MINLDHVTAGALVPDQLLPYVRSVSGLETKMAGAGILHHAAGHGVLVFYPAAPPAQADLDNAVEEALRLPGLEHLATIAPMRPTQAPPEASMRSDWYWGVKLPAPDPGAKTANMLRRGARELAVTSASGRDAWSGEHAGLVQAFCQRRLGRLDEGSVYLFQQLGNYLAGAREARLYSARLRRTNQLMGMALADFSAFNTAFYMFAFRAPDAPPGAADLLLAALLEDARRKGHALVNLGLGIDAGIEFFKRKWGAQKLLPYVETGWHIKKPKGWLARLFNR